MPRKHRTSRKATAATEDEACEVFVRSSAGLSPPSVSTWPSFACTDPSISDCTHDSLTMLPMPTTKSLATSPFLNRHLFLVSLGNPKPYDTTLHSAGHFLLDALRAHLGLPAFFQSNSCNRPVLPRVPGLFSCSAQHPTLMLWQCPSTMNVSGQLVSRAWKNYTSQLPAASGGKQHARLVVLHDELEAELGKLRVREGGSVKGHNGLKSCVEALGGSEGWLRVGVGIGRPVSREPEAVAGYVLGEMKVHEKRSIEGAAGLVAKVLEAVASEGEQAEKMDQEVASEAELERRRQKVEIQRQKTATKAVRRRAEKRELALLRGLRMKEKENEGKLKDQEDTESEVEETQEKGNDDKGTDEEKTENEEKEKETEEEGRG